MWRSVHDEQRFTFTHVLGVLTSGLVGLSTGQIMSWKFISEPTPQAALQSILFATFIGMFCGAIVRYHFEWNVVWFISGFCLGEFFGLIPVPFLGDTGSASTMSIITLNLAPLTAAFSMYPGNQIQRALTSTAAAQGANGA